MNCSKLLKLAAVFSLTSIGALYGATALADKVAAEPARRCDLENGMTGVLHVIAYETKTGDDPTTVLVVTPKDFALLRETLRCSRGWRKTFKIPSLRWTVRLFSAEQPAGYRLGTLQRVVVEPSR